MKEHYDNSTQLIATKEWTRKVGVSDVTVWRWCRKGWLSPLNINGRSYLRLCDIETFTRRAASGEFALAPRGAASITQANTETTPNRPENNNN